MSDGDEARRRLAAELATGDASSARELAEDRELAEVAAPGSSFTEGRGSIDTCVVVRVLLAADVAAMLPAGLQLAPQPLFPPGRHPLLVSCGRNRFGAWFGAMSYHEVMFAIPWVEYAEERTPHRGPFIYMPRLYLDEVVPRVLGNRVYGYEKLAAHIDAGAERWEVRDEHGDLLLRARFESAAAAAPPDDWPAFAWMRRMLEQPTISQASRIYDDDAREHGDATQLFLGSTVRYLLGGIDADGEPVEATIEPLRAELELGNGLSLPAGLPQALIQVPSLADDVLGAFRMRCPMIVSLPGSTAQAHHPPPGGRKLRVAVLGGGPAGCAAAYWLARQRERYEVDVYTMGWRLGGKCAGARNPAAHDRIEEHGLHAFPGFYENAFRTLREVYRDVGWPFDTAEGPARGAFVPRDEVGVMDRFGDDWRYFPTPVRRNDRTPGRVPPSGDDAPGHVGEALRGLLRRIGDELRGWLGVDDDAGEPDIVRLPGQRAIERVTAWVEREGAIRIEAIVETPLGASRAKRWVVRLLAEVRELVAGRYRERVHDDADAWFQWGVLDTLLTIAIGVLTESTLDFADLDDRDFLDWLVEHGLAPRHRDIATIMQVYETLFAHGTDAPIRYGELAAGVGLRWFLLMGFGFAGHIAWDFKWSCGETVMSPYLLALEKHGAAVHFFHRVTALELDGTGDAKRLARVRLAVQAKVKGGGPYHPFIGGATPDRTPPAWPDAPDDTQLEDGAAARALALESGADDDHIVGERVLEQGRDFDVCVLAIPIGALPPLVRALTDPTSPQHDPRWQALVGGVSLVPTVSAQLWLDRPAAELFAAPGERGLFTGFAHPQASLGRLDHLIAVERWPAPAPVSVLYHTGALAAGTRVPDDPRERLADAMRRRDDWREQFELWLARNHRDLFPRGPKSFEALLELLHVPEGTAIDSPADRLAAQWFCIATAPSDLYVLSRPREMRLRMAPHESGVRYLMLAGDWTKTDLDCGCVEAATQSGMLVARALSGEPVYVWRVGF